MRVEEKLAKVDRSASQLQLQRVLRADAQARRTRLSTALYLRQLYFENLTGERSIQPQGGCCANQLEQDFGSIENWWADVKAGLSSADGWLLLTRSRIDGRLYNIVIEEHHRGVFCEQDILLRARRQLGARDT